jgi:hypothetical protein
MGRLIPAGTGLPAYKKLQVVIDENVAPAPGLWDNWGMGLPSLLPCPGCARHVRRDEEACPFCGREVGSLFLHPHLQWFPAERLVPALLAFASVSAGVTACHRGERPTTRLVAAAPSPQMATPTSAAASRSAPAPAVPVASVAPSASVSALPSASAAQARPCADAKNLVAPGSRPMAVYGAPGSGLGPIGPSGRGAPGPPQSKVTVSLGVVRVQGATVANAERVVAGMGAGFRNCYQRCGLLENENMAGVLRLSLAVGPQGVVIDADVKQKGQAISAAVKDCIAARAQAAQFDPPEGASSAQIEFTATLKSEPPKSE